jgi:hypothetical protein
MSRRLDASTAEIVKVLQRYGYDVAHPVEIDLQEYQAKVTLTGNRFALVSKNDQGGWVMEYAKSNPAVDPDEITYHDTLCIYNALTRDGERLLALWNDSLGKPAFRDKAAEYSADLNQNSYLRRKIERILKAERNRQLANEQAEQEAAARAALETANAAARTGRRIAPPLPVTWE